MHAATSRLHDALLPRQFRAWRTLILPSCWRRRMGVTWSGCEFGPAVPLGEWRALPGGGVYAITFRKDNVDGSEVHVVVYFGEAADLAGGGVGPGHERHECWTDAAAGRKLYVSVHADDDGESRRAKERRLVDAWMPRCNRQ